MNQFALLATVSVMAILFTTHPAVAGCVTTNTTNHFDPSIDHADCGPIPVFKGPGDTTVVPVLPPNPIKVVQPHGGRGIHPIQQPLPSIIPHGPDGFKNGPGGNLGYDTIKAPLPTIINTDQTTTNKTPPVPVGSVDHPDGLVPNIPNLVKGPVYVNTGDMMGHDAAKAPLPPVTTGGTQVCPTGVGACRGEGQPVNIGKLYVPPTVDPSIDHPDGGVPNIPVVKGPVAISCTTNTPTAKGTCTTTKPKPVDISKLYVPYVPPTMYPTDPWTSVAVPHSLYPDGSPTQYVPPLNQAQENNTGSSSGVKPFAFAPPKVRGDQ